MQLRPLSIAILALACGCSSHPIAVCPADLRSSVAPADTTILAGEQFTARMTLLGCGGTKVLSDTITFQSSDLNVATVGTTTGVVIGVRSGTATIHASALYYRVAGDVHLTVR
jgi:hypothetical protein